MAEKLRIGVIGFGMIAKMAHMKGYQALPDDCEVVVACDLKAEARKIAADEYGIANTTADYQEVINDPTIDAVSVCTPNIMHMQPAIDALNAGKHVMCEKPLAMNGNQAKAMCKAARDAGKILQVGLQSRFGAPGQFMRQFIDNGNMGDIYYARAKALRRRGVPGWGVFTNKELQGGGPLIDIGVHILDFTLYMMGYPKPVSAFGKTWDTLGKDPSIQNFWGDYDRSTFTVEDFAAGMIKFENGAVVTLESSFMANMEGDPFESQLFGTKAGAIVNVLAHDKPVQIFKELDRQYFSLIPENIPHVENSYIEEIKAFVNAVQNGKPSPVPGENGLILNAIFDALYKSSETGHEEKVDVSLD